MNNDHVIEKYRKRVRNPMTAIRAMCVECMGGFTNEIDKCTRAICPLYQFRNGANPFRAHREGAGENLRILNEKRRKQRLATTESDEVSTITVRERGEW